MEPAARATPAGGPQKGGAGPGMEPAARATPAGGPRRSVWFRQYSFWGWQDSLDYSSLGSLPSRLARACPAAQTSTWRRSSMQPLWRAATKQMARNERLRFPCVLLQVCAPWCPCQVRVPRVPGGSVRDEVIAAGGSGTASTWTARRSKSSSARCWILRCSTQARSAYGPRRYWSRLPALSDGQLLACSPCPAPIQVAALRVSCSLC